MGKSIRSRRRQWQLRSLNLDNEAEYQREKAKASDLPLLSNESVRQARPVIRELGIDSVVGDGHFRPNHQISAARIRPVPMAETHF
jgi:hypothetical protein